MITLLGTSHVSARSSRDVKQAIPEYDIVCLELDPGRVEALVSEKRASFAELRAALGVKGALMASIMRWFQEKIAKDLGVVPGVEMKTALLVAAKQHKQIMVIDRPIQITFHRLSKRFGRREVWQMIKDSFRRQRMSIHPDDDIVAQLLAQMKDKYPRIYAVMVSERDAYMAKGLVAIHAANPDKRVLAIVGKAHVPGMLQQITYINKDVAVDVWSSRPTSANTSSSSV